MPNLAGIDVGLSFTNRSSGVCRTGSNRFRVGHTYADGLSRFQELRPVEEFEVVAVDGPVLPTGTLNYEVRPYEKVLVWKPFQTRCKPGETHVPGTGQALRRAGCDAAMQFENRVLGVACGAPFPRIQAGRNIVEAFPNGFLGVLLSESIHSQVPKLRRGERFDWLMDQFAGSAALNLLREMLDGRDEEFWNAIQINQQHDERAALICALTALCVWRGRYVTVGEPAGGYLFFPPWELWQPWAKDGLRANIIRLAEQEKLARVTVWIDGEAYGSAAELP